MWIFIPRWVLTTIHEDYAAYIDQAIQDANTKSITPPKFFFINRASEDWSQTYPIPRQPCQSLQEVDVDVYLPEAYQGIGLRD